MALIHGRVQPGFEPVRECFAANFDRDDEYRELGAAFAVFRGDELVVDLYGGFRDANRTRPWEPDTLVNIWSSTKGITAVAVAVLVDRGLVDYADLVGTHWPEYACRGKADTTVSHLLSHQAGLPGFVEPITMEEFYDWDVATARLAGQEPMWEPGTRNSYHAMTFGFLAGEIVRRASGLSIGAFVRRELAEALDADVHIGLPESEDARVAPLVPSPLELELDFSSVPPEALASITNPTMMPTLPNHRAWRAAEIPAGNGHATAVGLAKVYAVLANSGAFRGDRILQAETIDRLDTVQTDRLDIQLGIAPMWRNGLSGNVGGMYGSAPNAVGHSGWGGSFGSADRESGIAMGYVVNQMGHEALGDPRAVALANAVYRCAA